MEKAAHILICFHDFNRGGTERIAIGMAKRWADQGRRVTILCGARMGGLEDTSTRASRWWNSARRCRAASPRGCGWGRQWRPMWSASRPT
jgi:hypothetical protein